MLKSDAINYRDCSVYGEIKRKSHPKQRLQHADTNITVSTTSAVEGFKNIARQGVSNVEF